MSEAINLSVTLNRPYVPVVNQPQLVYALVEIMPADVVATVRMPLNFSLVLDQSGSMKNERKLDQLKRAVKYVIDLLEDDDYVSIVTFSGKATVVQPSTPLWNVRRDDLKRKIDKIDLKWTGTHIAVAVRAGLAEVRKEMTPDRVNRVVLLTDGQVQLSSGDHKRGERECLSVADECGQHGVSLLALGLGSDWNEALLQDMAGRSSGTADYIARPEDLAPFFQSVVQAMQAAVIRNAVFNVRLVAGVQPRKIWRVVPTISDLGHGPLSDRAISVSLGELEKAVGQALLVELLCAPRVAGRYRLAQAEVSYDVPQLGRVGERTHSDIVVEFTPDPALTVGALREAPLPRVMNIVERVQAFKLQTIALSEAAAGNLASAQQKLAGAVTMLLNQGETELAQQLQAETQRLARGQDISSEGRKTIQFKSSKTVRLGS
jgi:Ca-activated chloride channel family protein